MNLASISENRDIEKRIAITPEIAKKYISLGFKLTLPNNYGTYLGFTDDEYKNLGVNFSNNEKEIIKNYIDVLNSKEIYKNKIVTEIKQIEVFYEAEEYHQNFKKKNPNNPYILNVSNTRIKKFKTQYPFLFIN